MTDIPESGYRADATMVPEPTVWDGTPIEELNLPVRTYRVLKKAGFDRVGELVAHERASLVRSTVGLSDRMAGEIIAALLREHVRGALVADEPVDVLVLGGAGVETVVRVAALPVPFADSVTAPGITEHAGHEGTGVAVACTSLGLRVHLMDFFGLDRESEIASRRLLNAGAVVTFLRTERTRRRVTLVDPAGRRMSFRDDQDPPGARLPDQILLKVLPRVRHVHLTPMGFARHALPHLCDVSTSADLRDWDGASPDHEDLAYSCGLVFLSNAALGPRTHEVMARILDRGRAHTVVTADTGRCLTRDDPQIRPCRPAVGTETTGDGDAFTAAILAAHLDGPGLP